ncbi:hypothetical protein BDV93DRAFT_451158, partial [Ceratobasidium sp. AG-I]
RHKLSARILRRQVETKNDSMHDAALSQIATGRSDGWKNTKRTSLLASTLSVDHKVHDISADHKTADNHLKIVLEDIDHCKKEYQARIIAWVLDAGGD